MADKPVLYGQDNTGTRSRTLIANERTEIDPTLPEEERMASMVALVGVSYGGAGVMGHSVSGDAVVGWASKDPPRYKTTYLAGVYGWADGQYQGVRGEAEDGVGVVGRSRVGGMFIGRETGIHVEGPVKLTQCAGVVKVATGTDRATVHYPLGDTDFVLATLQSFEPDLYVLGVQLRRPLGLFSVHLSHAVAHDTKLGWVVITSPIVG